jgi:hypothetical protein
MTQGEQLIANTSQKVAFSFHFAVFLSFIFLFFNFWGGINVFAFWELSHD